LKLLVFGTGGHAKVVIDAARAVGLEVVGVVGQARGRSDVMGLPIAETVGGIDADAFVVAVGDNRTRATLFAEGLAAGLIPATVIHPSAVIAESANIGLGTFVAAGVVVNVDARIGQDAILNTSCTVDHDCLIGDHAHVGPTSGLCGGVHVGTGALVGVGCSVIPGRHIGEWSVLGAGSALIDNVPDGGTFAGVPARAIEPRTEAT